MKKYYQTLNKKEKDKIKQIYKKEYHKSELHVRLIRLLIYACIGYFMGILLYIDAFIEKSETTLNIIIATTLIIASTIFLIGHINIKRNTLNQIALKNKRK